MLGDRSVYAGFKYGTDLSWQANPSAPVGINPPGATIQGRNVDGVIPDDQRRAGSFSWPAPCENHVRMGMNGLVVEAQLLARAGYPAWTWSSSAIKRATTWLTTVTGCGFPGDDVWMPYLLNKAYGLSLPLDPTSDFGKNISWVSWTHGTGSSSSPPPPPPDGGTGGDRADQVRGRHDVDVVDERLGPGRAQQEQRRSGGGRRQDHHAAGRDLRQGHRRPRGVRHPCLGHRLQPLPERNRDRRRGRQLGQRHLRGVDERQGSYSSGAMSGSTATKTVDVPLSGSSELRLVVSSNGSINSDHADWADARLTC